MHWFRVHKWYGFNAALLALLIQFAVSFGHVHPENFEPQSTTLAVSIPGPSSAGGSAYAPLDNDWHNPIGYLCDVCVTLSLLASAQISAPPALLVNFVFLVVVATIAIDATLTELRSLGFRSRAPPTA